MMRLIHILIFSFFLTSCSSSDDKFVIEYDFSESNHGFEIDTAFHPVEDDLNDIIVAELSDLPSPFEYRKGIMFHWLNDSSRFQGFLKKKITEHRLSEELEVIFEVTILSNTPSECPGIGNTPGSVLVSGAILPDEPVKTIETEFYEDIRFDNYVININNGTAPIGTIALPVACTDGEHVWETKTVTSEPMVMRLEEVDDEAWIYIAIDSGFRGITTFYLMDVSIQITPK